MIKTIPVSRLRGLKVVFQDDLYELAQFVLKFQQAHDPPTTRTRTTVHGLLTVYEYVARLSSSYAPVPAARHGLPLDATIVPDGELITEYGFQSADSLAARRQTPDEQAGGRGTQL